MNVELIPPVAAGALLTALGFFIGWVMRIPRLIEVEDRLQAARRETADAAAHAHAAECRATELGRLARSYRKRLSERRRELQQRGVVARRLKDDCSRLIEHLQQLQRAFDLQRADHLTSEAQLKTRSDRVQARLDAVLSVHHRHRDLEGELGDARQRIAELEAFGAMEAHVAADESHTVERLRRDLAEARAHLSLVPPSTPRAQWA